MRRYAAGNHFGQRLALPLIRIALADHLFGQAVRRKQQGHLLRFTRAPVAIHDPVDMRRHEVFVERIAADRFRLTLERRLPGRQGRTRRGRGELRIEGQQHYVVGAPALHIGCGFFRERVPVAHGDEAFHLVTRQGFGQLGFQRPGLKFGFAEQGRAAAGIHHRVILDHRRRAGPGNQTRQQPTDRQRRADDRGIAEQVLEERLHRRGFVRTAEIEQYNGDLAAHRQAYPFRIRARTRSTFAIGVSGRTPWPRLKIWGRPR